MPSRNPKHDCTAEDGANSIVPAGVPDWITAELIERTIAVWQPYYDEVLTPEDAATMIVDVGRLYRALSSGSPP